MKNIDIWVEGFKNGDTLAPAVLLKTVRASDFTAACKIHVKKDPTFARHYDQRRHTFWGCKIFATKEKAQGRFG